jgi:myo-inositol-1(or 4)-monophosphatase
MPEVSIDLGVTLMVADELAHRAGELLREAMRHPRQIGYKGAVNLVTESDRQSEELIVGGLLKAFPDFHIVAEEGGGRGAPIETAPYRWYVDPLDGTTNFAHGIPHFAVSLALAEPDGKPLLGIVYDPMRDECFRAVQGGGATLNGQPIHVSTVSDLSEAALATGFPYDRRTNPNNNIEEFSAFLLRTQSVSRLGSSALNLCYVAAGRFDGYWEMRINPWDILAGLLCVMEAGGRVSNYRGQLDGLYQGCEVVATNGLIHERLLTVIALGHDSPLPGEP